MKEANQQHQVQRADVACTHHLQNLATTKHRNTLTSPLAALWALLNQGCINYGLLKHQANDSGGATAST